MRYTTSELTEYRTIITQLTVISFSLSLCGILSLSDWITSAGLFFNLVTIIVLRRGPVSR